MPMPVEFVETEIEGVLEVKVGRIGDDRGFFSEAYSDLTWREQGFNETFLQDSMSMSAKGTLRGMHYQIEPAGMGKLVRVITGSIFDVGVDLRKGSPTFGKWVGRTLTAENGVALWFPIGFAHGFVALEDRTIVYYKCTNVHTPEAERALSYKDPTVAIEWPVQATNISPKDAEAPCLADAECNFVFKGG